MQWIKCSKQMPETEDEFIVYDRKRGVTAAYFDKKYQYKPFHYSHQWVKVYEGCGEHVLLENEQVTHWMPLPDKPNGE